MAEKSKDVKDAAKARGGPSAARLALGEGDSALARRLARAALADPASTDETRAEARAILAMTRLDTAALGAGLAALAVLAVLFFLVLTGRF